MAEDKDPASTIDTPAADTKVEEATEATEAAEESVENLKTRITDLEKRLTKEGRSKASIKSETDALRAELDEAVAVNDRWHAWWLENAASDEEKQSARNEAKSTEVGEVQAAKVQTGHWQAIAEEENATVKKVLAAAAKKGDFMTAGQIAALRESLASDDDDEKPTKAEPKTAPHVTGPRATGAPKTSIQDRKDEAKKTNNFEAFLDAKTDEALASGR